jgi:uncharacterized membrane protein YbhN (UPF0104 family)
LRSVLVLVLALGLIAFAARDVEVRPLLDVLGRSNGKALALAALLGLVVAVGAGAQRLWCFVRPLAASPGISRGQFLSVYLASSAAHNLLPAPAGEVLRTLYVARTYGYSVGALTAAQLLDKLVDALGLGIEALVVAAVVLLPGTLGLHITTFGCVVCVAVLLLVLGARWRPAGAGPVAPPAGRIARFLSQLRVGLSLLRDPSVLLRSLGWSMLSDAGNLLTVPLVLWALGAEAGPGAWFAVMAAARVSGLIPATPGQIGVQELGIVLVLRLFEVEQSVAIAAALVYRVVHFVPVTLLGLLELRRLAWWRGTRTNERAQPVMDGGSARESNPPSTTD